MSWSWTWTGVSAETNNSSLDKFVIVCMDTYILYFLYVSKAINVITDMHW